ncbi:mammalian cell entry protein [Mycobacteroides saopaulense]|uniref:MlaD family protein n=1 Tax=Mycobacteroides saopaulense TaxID=1578165 RepID=UPI0007203285|nr:MlaD family protein [Mycobacteroides saopaulense]ALR10749.1 mammalian cell entry protein [Mycobacteroides saopaulense]
MRRAVKFLVALPISVIVLISGCSSTALDPTRMPVPGGYTPRNGYSIRIEFSSALNLPGRAKVDFGGIQIGVLDHLELVDTTAVAHVEIDGGTILPANTRAELRQATVLGDIYIAMIAPDRPTPEQLHAGDTISLQNTAPASNVEDLLRSMSTYIGGGTLNTLQETIINVNKAFPQPEELTHIHRNLTGMLHDLASNSQTIDEMITSLQNITGSLVENTRPFQRLLIEGPQKLSALAEVAVGIVDLVVALGRLSTNARPLVDTVTPDFLQMISYFTPFLNTATTADTTIPVLADKTVRLIRDRLIPFFGDGGPKYTVTGINTPGQSLGVDPAERADEVVRRMQTMGLLR